MPTYAGRQRSDPHLLVPSNPNTTAFLEAGGPVLWPLQRLDPVPRSHQSNKFAPVMSDLGVSAWVPTSGCEGPTTTHPGSAPVAFRLLLIRHLNGSDCSL